MPEKPATRKSKSQTKAKDGSEREAQKAQSARFVETARALGVDESGLEFEEAIARVVPGASRASLRNRKSRTK
jgi:hypothetical protein